MPFLQLDYGTIAVPSTNQTLLDLAVSGTADGGYVLVRSVSNSSTHQEQVIVQRYDATGTTLGSPIVVQSYAQDYPRVDVLGLAGGGFVVTWSADGPVDGAYEIYARIYDATGAPRGATFQVNSVTDGSAVAPAVESTPGGGFEIFWNGGTASQAYTAAGAPVGAEMSHEASPPEEQVRSDLGDGSYLLATPDGLVEHHAEDGALIETFQIPLLPANFSFPYDLGAVAGGLVYVAGDTMRIIDFNEDGLVSGDQGRAYGGDGADQISADHGHFDLYGAAGDDVLSVTHQDMVTAGLDGGAGNDTIHLTLQGGDEAAATGGDGDDSFTRSGGGTTDLSGGLGDDDFVVSGSGAVTIAGGAGDDVIQISNLSAVPTIDLGIGHDTLFMYGGSYSAGTGVVTIQRFDAGAGGDELDLYALLDDLLTGWDGVSNPSASGHLRLVQQGSYATIQIDFNGGGDSFVDLVRFVEDGTALTEENLGFTFGSVLVAGGVTFGTSGNDTALSGTSGDDVIRSLGGKDSVNGLNGNDFIQGGDADDQLAGNAGDDLLQGGAGDDNLRGGAGADLLDGGDGFDWVNYDTSASIDLMTGITGLEAAGDRFRSIEGYRFSDGADSFAGSDADEVIDGGLGQDYMAGRGGNDYYYVSQVNDIVVEAAGEGTDTVEATSGYTLGDNIENLKLKGLGAGVGIGNALNNTIIGNGIANILDGGAGADSLSGGAGGDTYYVDNVGDKVFEKDGYGTDRVYASVSYSLAGQYVENLILTGTANIAGTGNGIANAITGNSGNNALNGAGGNDILNGGAGADKMTGGTGDDRFLVDDAADQVIELADGGYDSVESTVSYVLAPGDVEALTLTGAAANGTGNAIDNVITGNNAVNVLDGGAGADTMIGMRGDDRYIVDNIGDVVVETNTFGKDTVEASVSYTLSAYVEGLLLTGNDAIDGTGNELDNKLTGNDAANVLNGGAGNDVLTGGAGNDRLIGGGHSYYGIDKLSGGLGDDTYVVDPDGSGQYIELAGEGIDTMEGVKVSLANNMEIARLTGVGNGSATGNVLANILYGNSGNNLLNGAGGADTMYGGAGNDTFIVDNVGDKVLEANGEGTDEVQSLVTYSIAGQYVETLLLGGSGAIGGTGNSLDNRIEGNLAANKIAGGAGDDVLNGGLGGDTLTGGTGLDHFWFDTELGATNVDRITDFNVADDTIDLDRSIFSGIAADGALDTGAFRLGTAAVDADDRILYDKATGNLYYDADGVGGAAAVLFAQVAVNTNLTAADFFGHS